MLKPALFTFWSALLCLHGFAQRPIKPVPNEASVYQMANQQTRLSRTTESTLDFGDTPSVSLSGSFGGSSSDVATDVTSDAAGNVFVCGYFSGEITPGSTLLTSTGQNDGFVAKYNSSGELQWWTILPAESEKNVKPKEIFIDSDGKLIVAGLFDGELDLGLADPLTTVGTNSVFYARLDASGTVTSNVNVTESISPVISGFNTDTNIEIKLGQDVSDNLFILIVDGYSSSYLQKYSSLDVLGFAQTHDEIFNDLLITGTSLYLSGRATQNNDGLFNNNITVTLASEVNTNAIVAKLDLAGDFQWVSLVNHEKETDVYSGTSEAYGVTLGDEGKLILYGELETYGGFGSSSMTESGAFFSVFDENGVFQDVVYTARGGWFKPFQLIYMGTNGYIEYNEDRFITRDTDRQIIDELSPNYPLHSVAVTTNNKLIKCGEKTNSIFIEQEAQITHATDYEIAVESNSARSSILSIETDPDGNIYYYGFTTNTIDAFGQKVDAGYFLTKVDASGSTQWAKNFKTDSDRYDAITGMGDAMVVDPTGAYIYVVAAFEGTLDIPGGSVISADTDGSTAIIKFGTGGSYSQAWKEDVIDYDFDLAVDSNANVFFTGTFSNTVVIGGVSLTANSAAFVVKYNSSGIAQWTKKLGGDGTVYTAFSDVDSNGNIYNVGEHYSSNIYLDDVEIETPADGDGNILIVKLNAEGELQWSKMTGGDNDETTSYEYSTWATGIAVDHDGNIFLKGWMGKTVYFDDILLSQSNFYHHFISKFDNDGNALWAKAIEQVDNYGFDYNEFTIDLLGNVYFAIQSRGTIKFADGLSYTPTNQNDLYVTKYTSDGQFGWLKVLEGGQTISQMYGLGIVGTHTICIGGNFGDKITLGDETKTALQINSGFYATMTISNSAPVFTSTAPLSIASGVKYSYNITSEDTDEMPTLSISALDLPSWLTLTDHGDGTATLEGTPSAEELADQEISLYVSDAVQTNFTKQAFTLSQGTVAKVLDNGTQLQLYPNPTENRLTIQSNKHLDLSSIQIIDPLGKAIKPNVTMESKAISLDLTNLKSGLYILRFQLGSQAWSQSFVKK